MALISCSECGKEVSEKAYSCPNCGAPISSNPSVSPNPQPHAKVKRAGAKWEAVGFILIVVGMLMAIAKVGSGVFLLVVGFTVFLIGRFK